MRDCHPVVMPSNHTHGSAHLATQVRPPSGLSSLPAAKPDCQQTIPRLGPRGGLHLTHQTRKVTPDGEAHVPKSGNQGAHHGLQVDMDGKQWLACPQESQSPQSLESSHSEEGRLWGQNSGRTNVPKTV